MKARPAPMDETRAANKARPGTKPRSAADETWRAAESTPEAAAAETTAKPAASETTAETTASKTAAETTASAVETASAAAATEAASALRKGIAWDRGHRECRRKRERGYCFTDHVVSSCEPPLGNNVLRRLNGV